MLKPRLVLVEDDGADAQLVGIALAQSGVAAELAHYEDGQQAVDELLAPSAPPPALILLDLKLPRLDGKEVLRRVRAKPETAMTPVVIMSSSDRPDDIRDCYGLGANSFVRKPLEFEEYSRCVTLLLRFWLTTNLCPPP